MSVKKIDQNLARITTNSAKLNDLIHATAMLIMKHAQKHGDCTRALSLVNAMPASMRRTTLISWFTRYSPIRIVFANQAVGMLKKDEKGYKPFDIDKAQANPFHTIAEKIVEAGLLDFAALCKLVEGLGKRIEKQVEEGRVAPEDVPSAQAMVLRVKGLKFDRVVPAPAANDEQAGDLEARADLDAGGEGLIQQAA